MSQELHLPSIQQRRPMSKGSSQSVKNLHYDQYLEDSMRSDNQNINQSPFKLPQDDEAFLYCQMEKQKREEGKRGMHEQHIWDKKTATSKNSLKHYKGFQAYVNDKHQTQTAYRSEEKKLIQNALEICKKRKQNKDSQQKRESIVDVLEQKKEMFLVTMSHGIIGQEIQRLKNIVRDRESALSQSKKMLKQDEQYFNEYLEKNKQDKQQAEQAADNETKDKKNKEQQYKELNIKLTSIRAEKSRNEELVQNFIEHKTFLDQLASKDWQDEKERKLQILIEENFDQWLQNEIQKYQDEDNNKNIKKSKQKQDKVNFSSNPNWRKQKRQEYLTLAENKQLDFVQEFNDEYPLHFQEPRQLVEHFDTMEQKNLNQLSDNQQLEEQYEQTLSSFQKIETEFNRRTNLLQEQKDMFKKQLDEVDNQIKAMKRKSEENKNLINKEGQELTQRIEELYKIFQSELPFISDFKSQNIITILSQIEIYMEKQLKNLKLYPPKMVEEQRYQAKKTRGIKNRKQQNEKLDKEIKEKNQKNLDKLMSNTRKKEGRRIMEKSKPLIKEQKVEEQQEDNSDEEDKKYFQEGYVLL